MLHQTVKKNLLACFLPFPFSNLSEAYNVACIYDPVRHDRVSQPVQHIFHQKRGILLVFYTSQVTPREHTQNDSLLNR